MIVDGMNVAASDGGQLPYTNDQMEAEVSVRTSALPAEISSGGVNLNSIPKDGGNIFTGAAFLGGFTRTLAVGQHHAGTAGARPRPRRTRWRTSGSSRRPSAGPIKRNKAWFFFGARHADADEIVADTPAYVTLTAAQLNRPSPTGARAAICGPFGLRPGDVERTAVSSYIRDVMLRLTTQVTASNKFAHLFNRGWKDKDNEYGFGTDPVFAVEHSGQQGRALSVGLREVDVDREQPVAGRGGLGVGRVCQDDRSEALQPSAALSAQRAGESGVDRQRAAPGQRAEQESVLHAARWVPGVVDRRPGQPADQRALSRSRRRCPMSPGPTTSRWASLGRSGRTARTSIGRPT